MSLAGPLKAEYAVKHDMTLEELDEAKNKYESVRRGLIDYGRAAKQVDLNVWVKKALAIPGNLIVPDARYLHEIEYVEAFNSPTFTLRINASRENRAKRGTLTNEDDASETELDFYNDWYFEIENNKGNMDLTHECEVVAEVLIPYLNRATI